MRESYNNYVIVGGGKTSIDAVLHLLDHGLHPDKIIWVVPADSWLFNRDNLSYDENMIDFFQAIFAALSVETDQTCQDVYLR